MFSIVFKPSDGYEYISRIDYRNYVLILKKNDKHYLMDENLILHSLPIEGKFSLCDKNYIITTVLEEDRVPDSFTDEISNACARCYRLVRDGDEDTLVLKNKIYIRSYDIPIHYDGRFLYTSADVNWEDEQWTEFSRYSEDGIRTNLEQDTIATLQPETKHGLLYDGAKIIDLTTDEIFEYKRCYFVGNFIVFPGKEKSFVRDYRQSMTEKKLIHLRDDEIFLNMIDDRYYVVSDFNVYEVPLENLDARTLIITCDPYMRQYYPTVWSKWRMVKNFFVIPPDNPRTYTGGSLIIRYFPFNIKNLLKAIENEKDDIKRSALEIVAQHLSMQEPFVFDVTKYGDD